MKRLLMILWRTSRTDLRLAWYALRHPSRPAWLLPALIGLGLYALSPLSYAIPLLGAVDDLVVVPLLLHGLLKLLPDPIRMYQH
ncbi:hypothetical protein EDC30_104188 [Paucimonas lemoignei]|uniref:DUF1232 domain-containing protein n=1 Tax=Paucimonas lemoignei TaxID=29443 RepID=A0A4R3HYS5_PAULE|nr:hypothetical protein [Paucimonas lemoignei]TCS37385.1 hypothetical protein EDC30_104188 [Paucimonas lemoignei]